MDQPNNAGKVIPLNGQSSSNRDLRRAVLQKNDPYTQQIRATALRIHQLAVAVEMLTYSRNKEIPCDTPKDFWAHPLDEDDFLQPMLAVLDCIEDQAKRIRDLLEQQRDVMNAPD